ncbi:MAG: glycosyltransferase [Candidatus Nanosalina sp.]
MKIAFLTDTYLPTINGVTYTIYNWKSELESQGHEVDVVCPSPGNEDENILFRSVRFPFYEGFRAPVLPPLSHDFSDYDVIHVHSFFLAGAYGYYLSWKHDTPLVTHVHTPIEDFLDYVSESKVFEKLVEKVYTTWEDHVIEASELSITPTVGRKEDVRDRVDQEVKVLTNGVDMDFFSEGGEEEFREKHGIESEKVIGYTGRLGKEKRLEELFELAGDFEGEIVIGGDGPMRKRYEEICEDKDNVKFLGFIDREELPKLYTTMDVFVFPSRVEAEGLVVLESNACGTPVVGANAKGLKSSIQNDINGYKYEPGDTEDLRDKLDKAYDNLEKLSKSAREKVKEKSVSSSVRELVESYRKLE